MFSKYKKACYNPFSLVLMLVSNVRSMNIAKHNFHTLIDWCQDNNPDRIVYICVHLGKMNKSTDMFLSCSMESHGGEHLAKIYI